MRLAFWSALVAVRLAVLAALLGFAGRVALASEPTSASKVLCVYCASSDDVDPKYLAMATHVGEEAARRGWTLLYGGSKSGLMGAVARGAKSRGARIIGVRPDLLGGREKGFDGVDEFIPAATISERKHVFQTRATAFLALPGGIGTLDELCDTLELDELETLRKPVVIFNQDGYYDDLLAFFNRGIREKFIREKFRSRFAVATSLDDVFALLEAQGLPPVPPKPDAWDKSFAGVVHDAQRVCGFVEEYRWLSNFWPCRVDWEGRTYGSSEAAYQSAKFPPEQRDAFTHLDPDAAKKLAHSKSLPDTAAWDARKERVMREIIWAKFSANPDLAAKLRATGTRYLEETNWWGDEIWGVYQGKGQNLLGKILMDARSRLAAAAGSGKK